MVKVPVSFASDVPSAVAAGNPRRPRENRETTASALLRPVGASTQNPAGGGKPHPTFGASSAPEPLSR